MSLKAFNQNKLSLKEIGYFYGGLSGKSGNDFGVGDAKFITFLNVINNVIANSELTGYVDVKKGEQQNKVLLGDLLFNGSSETPDEVAFPSLVPKSLEGSYLNSFCFGFRFEKFDRIDPLFFAYYLRSNYGRQYISQLAQGSTRYNISKTALLKLEWALPEFEEQKAIAKALSDIDKLISELGKCILKKENIFLGLLQEMFGQSSNCSSVAIGSICEIQKGSASSYDKEFESGEYGFLNGGIEFSGFTTSFNDPGDTVVVSEGGNSCGFVNYIDRPFWCGGHAYRLLDFEGSQKYLYFAMKAQESEIMNLRVGSGLPNVQKKNLAEFEINMHPQPSKQNEVAEFLDVASEEILAIKNEKFKYECIKQGMMNDLLTGKVRLV